MDEELLYLAAFVALVSVAVATSIIAVKREGRNVDVLLKQLIIWAGIAALLPLSTWAGATMVHPRTHLKDLEAQRDKASRAESDAKSEDQPAKQAARDEQERLGKEIDKERQSFYRSMFWVSFPIGIVTLAVGMFLRPVAVGTGLAFGGLCTLTSGCYSYWDDMGDGLRFFSLLATLVLLVAIGLVKFRRAAEQHVVYPAL